MATIDMEQLDGVVGCFCTLLYPRRGQTEGTIVEDLGCEVIVQLINGKEVTEYKETLSKILCKWKQDSVVSLFLYLDSVFKHKHKLIHNQAPV